MRAALFDEMMTSENRETRTPGIDDDAWRIRSYRGDARRPL